MKRTTQPTAPTWSGDGDRELSRTVSDPLTKSAAVPGFWGVLLAVLVNLAISGMITLIAMIWCIMNIRRQYQGPLLLKVSHTHGVHVFDAAVLVVEVMLICLFIVSLVITARSAPRQHGD